MIVIRNFSKFFGGLGQIMAFLTVALLGLLYINSAAPIKFLPENWLNIMERIKDYAVIVTLTVCGLGFASKRSLIIFVLFCVLALAALACYSIVLFKI